MSRDTRHQNRGLRKVCGCARRAWAKCAHPWHFNFKVRGGPSYRFSVDVEAGKHITSKTVAEGFADGWRQQIREGTFRRRADGVPAPAPAAPTAALTLETLGERYFERRGKPATASERSCLRRFLAFDGLATTPITSLTEDAIEAFFAHLQTEGYAASSRNHYVQLVKALFRWATKKGYFERNPIGESEAIKRSKAARRNRRLEPGEEQRLIAVAQPHLQNLIIAAIETGMRLGELLGLTWHDVHLERREILLPAERTKTRTARHVPMSARLAAVLEMARLDPAGDAYGPADFVFGVVGRPVKSVKRAWQTAVVRAAGHTPQWTTAHTMAPETLQAFHAADLHFHDLRHEAGSRYLEAGWPLHHVQQLLGHTNIAQTSTYLNAQRLGLQESMRAFDAARCKADANAGESERPPLRNDETTTTGKALVN
jgi:integrase